MSIRTLALLALASLAPSITAQNGTARYELVFSSSWSRATHPISFPGNPHYSPLIGGTHDGNVTFWQPGGIATQGIENMAETGSTSALSNEINAAINAGTADQRLQYGGVANSPGQRTVQFTMTRAYSQLTLVTMLAPSPDWFLGVHNLELAPNGQWVDQLDVPLFVYDAGTDSGVSYTSPNLNTNPKQPIARVTTSSGPFLNNPAAVGTFSIRRLGSTSVVACANPNGSMAIGGTEPPAVGGTMNLRLDDPSGAIGGAGATALAIAGSGLPCGTMIPGLGQLLLGSPLVTIPGPAFNGAPVVMTVRIPNQASLTGQTFFFQGVVADANRAQLTDGVELLISR